MKLLPLTPESHKELIRQGYTHIILSRVVNPHDRDYTSHKELHILQAVRNTGDNIPNSDKASHCIHSDIVNDMLREAVADYMILIKDR